MGLSSQLFQGDPKLEAAAISDPAHIVPGDRGDHVRKIQIALLQLDGAKIATDGIYGAGTAAAVLAYKTKRGIINRAYQSQPDNIVGKMTMAVMDTELSGNDDGDDLPTSRSRFHTCEVELKGKGGHGSSATDVMAPDPATAALAISLVPKVRIAIKAAQFHLLAASPFVTDHKLTSPTGPFQAQARQSIHLLINIFSLDKFKNPLPGFDNIRRVFANMDVALNRSFETNPLIAPALFVPNIRKSQESTALAYTTAGGAFKSDKSKMKGLGVPSNRIYICGDLLKTNALAQIETLVHELAHYVSGRPLKISHEHGVPKEGDMLTNRAPLDRIEPEAKLRSAEHYAFFAMAASFRKLLP